MGKSVEELIQEARGLKGMVAEVGCVARSMRNNIEERGRDVTMDMIEMCQQMEDDLAKYSYRLCDIFEELGTYGIAPELE